MSESGDLGKRVDDYLTRITPFGFSGAALLAKEGRIVLNKGYGLANRHAKMPNKAQTVFSLGSITKQFTAAAIMKLEMQGKLHTDDPIKQYFPHVPDDKANITLHQLLTHTAGLINDTGEDYEMADKEATILKILESGLLFPPGSDYDYANAGYTLLAAVIEQVARQPYEHFLQENLFQPAGMKNTGYRLPDWSEAEVAHWYNGRLDFGTPLEKPYPSWNLLGNGDMLSTTEDMFRWHLALLGNNILSKAAKEKMYTPEQQDYAYGWRTVETENGLCIQHNGASSHGSSALFRRWIAADVVLMLFCNTDYHGDVLMLTLQEPLEALIFGQDVPLPPPLPAISPAPLAPFAGKYALPDDSVIHAAVENGALHLTPDTQAGINWLLGLDEADTAVYIQALQKTRKLMKAALAGNTDPLLQSLTNREQRAHGVLRTWQTLVEAVQPTEMNVLGIRPSLYLDHACEAVTLFTGPAASLCFISIWRGGQNAGVLLTELGRNNIFTAVAQPAAANTLATYHLAYAQTNYFQVLQEDDMIHSLVSEQNISARRV